ncbi:MAG: hypothetical protein ACP5MD_12705, partial [Verrucomicrobiia bacterium]
MTTRHTYLRGVGFGGWLAIASAVLWFSSVEAGSPPKLKVDDSALPAESRPTLSFSHVVKKVAPSVVNIYSTKTVRQNPAFSPFFDDPFFRRFFG